MTAAQPLGRNVSLLFGMLSSKLMFLKEVSVVRKEGCERRAERPAPGREVCVGVVEVVFLAETAKKTQQYSEVRRSLLPY